jgi:hypothetical protein
VLCRYGFSDTACELYNTIITARPDYFNSQGGREYFTRKDLALVPNRFLLYESTDEAQVRPPQYSP